jgi:mannose-6-phosphate isomerase-like protein (cupin superfamily)
MFLYIPVGAVRSPENTPGVSLYLIEVQSGSYFGDDIERLEDLYGRC